MEKEEQKCLITDIAIANDKNVGVKEEEKIQKYDELKREIKELWWMKRVNHQKIPNSQLSSQSFKIIVWVVEHILFQDK